MSLSLHYNGEIKDKDSYDIRKEPVLAVSGYRLAGPSPFTPGDPCFFHAPSHRLRFVLVSLR